MSCQVSASLRNDVLIVMYYGTFEEHMRCEHLPYSVRISRPTPEGDSAFKQSQLCLDVLPAYKTQELDQENALEPLFASME